MLQRDEDMLLIVRNSITKHSLLVQHAFAFSNINFHQAKVEKYEEAQKTWMEEIRMAKKNC